MYISSTHTIPEDCLDNKLFYRVHAYIKLLHLRNLILHNTEFNQLFSKSEVVNEPGRKICHRYLFVVE